MECCQALARVRDLNRRLGGSEFKLVFEMTCRADDRGVCTASHQDLAESTGSSVSAVRRSLDCFENHHRLIDGEQATPNRPKSYRLLFLGQQVPEVPLFKLSTPPVQIEHPSAQNDQVPLFKLNTRTPVPLFKLNTPPVQIEHPPNQESTTYEAPSKEDARVDIDPTGLTEEIDRRQNAPRTVDADELAARLERITPAQIEPALLASFRQELASYRARFAPPGTVTEPDNRIVAQFLSIAPPRVLGRFLEDLLLDRKRPGDSYGWFVAVAAQRILHILPEDLRTARQRRREQSGVVMKPPQRETDPGWRTGFQDQVRAAAAGKRL